MKLSHFEIMVIFALCISIIIAIISKEGAKAQIRYFLLFFLILIFASLAIAWLMYPFPR
jgi:hypothetical protein